MTLRVSGERAEYTISSVDAAAHQIGFTYVVSGDFFTQVAKLRAARWLWAKVVVTAGGEPSAAAMQIHCRTSPFTKAERDPWVNMLRVTAECTAAVFGGAQSVATSRVMTASSVTLTSSSRSVMPRRRAAVFRDGSSEVAIVPYRLLKISCVCWAYVSV